MIKRGYIHFDCKNRGRRPEGNCFGYKKKQATSVGRRVSNLDQEFIANDLPSLDKTVCIFCLPLLLFAPPFFQVFQTRRDRRFLPLPVGQTFDDVETNRK